MERLRRLYYSSEGYQRGESAVDFLHEKTSIDKKKIRDWLRKQAIWQIYLPAPDYTPRPTSMNTDAVAPNIVHEMDILYLPWDTVKRKVYKYAVTVVDVGSRYKEAEPITSKTALQALGAVKAIYARSPLKRPSLLKVDSGSEFKGEFKNWITSKGTTLQVGTPNVHRSQGIVERFNRTLAERLFGYQYAQEMLNPSSRNREWVARLPAVIKALNNEVTRLIGLKPVDAIKQKEVQQTPSAGLPKGSLDSPLNTDVLVRYLYAPGEQEGGTHRRATDPIWSVDIYRIDKMTSQFKTVKGKRVKSGPTLYWLKDGPDRSFVKQELQVVPFDTEVPPLAE